MSIWYGGSRGALGGPLKKRGPFEETLWVHGFNRRCFKSPGIHHKTYTKSGWSWNERRSYTRSTDLHASIAPSVQAEPVSVTTLAWPG